MVSTKWREALQAHAHAVQVTCNTDTLGADACGVYTGSTDGLRKTGRAALLHRPGGRQTDACMYTLWASCIKVHPNIPSRAPGLRCIHKCSFIMLLMLACQGHGPLCSRHPHAAQILIANERQVHLRSAGAEVVKDGRGHPEGIAIALRSGSHAHAHVPFSVDPE